MKKECMCGGHLVSAGLLVIGGINWGLVGVAMLLAETPNWNVINLLLGSVPTLEAVVYILVGLAALMMLVKSKCKGCKTCKA